MIKATIAAFCVGIILTSCTPVKELNYLVGTYTIEKTDGINLIKFNEKTKELSLVSVVTGIQHPSFVIANKSKTIVVAVEEIAGNEGGKVTSFSYNASSKVFQKLSSFYTKGNHPCTVAFSPKEEFILVGNYSGGNLAVFPIDASGKLSEMCENIKYEGSSTNVERQEKSHVHCIVIHPKEPTVLVADLGRDAIEIIPFDENSKTFLQKDKATSYKVEPGSGPRHLVFNSAGNRLYVTYELTNEIGVFEYVNSNLKHIQTVSLTLPTKSGSAAELRLSNDGNFLYASVRGNDDEILVMKTNGGSKLEVIQTIKTLKKPRNFILTPNQKQVLVATQNSNLISVFDRDVETGLLKATSKELTITKPVYLFPF